MNSFDYWFEYIKRNGTYRPSSIDTSYWILRTGGYIYWARFVGELDTSLGRYSKERFIRVLKDNSTSWEDIATASDVRPLNHERLSSEAFKALVSIRKII